MSGPASLNRKSARRLRVALLLTGKAVRCGQIEIFSRFQPLANFDRKEIQH